MEVTQHFVKAHIVSYLSEQINKTHSLNRFSYCSASMDYPIANGIVGVVSESVSITYLIFWYAKFFSQIKSFF